MEKSLGLIEVVGLAAAIEAADAACKTANVELVGYERAKGGGMITIKIVGQVGAVKAAITAAKAAAGAVNKVVSCRVIARPDKQIAGLVTSKDTVGVQRSAPAPVEAPPATPPAAKQPAPAPVKSSTASVAAAKKHEEIAPSKETGNE